MNYFDSSRPRQANGLPMYMDRQGNGIAPLPALAFDPQSGPGLKWLASVWLVIERPGTAKCFTCECAWPGVLLEQYLDDPEYTLATHFNYVGPAAPKSDKTPAQTPSLEDLGL